MRVLNVGGNNKAIPIPKCFDGWEHEILDIDPTGKPDICCDARELQSQDIQCKYDAVYNSHNLEHYYAHDVPKVLRGFYTATKDDGFVWVSVPNLAGVMAEVVNKKLAFDDVLYRLSDNTPIYVNDVIFGWGKQIQQSGEDFFAHKCGFSRDLLGRLLADAGFKWVAATEDWLNITMLGFKQEPTQERVNEILGV